MRVAKNLDPGFRRNGQRKKLIPNQRSPEFEAVAFNSNSCYNYKKGATHEKSQPVRRFDGG
jgi:hypothetical protein